MVKNSLKIFQNISSYTIAGYHFLSYSSRNKKIYDRIVFPTVAKTGLRNVKKIKTISYKSATITGIIISHVTNRSLTLSELNKLCLVGAISAVYDDFFDNLDYTPDQLQELTFSPKVITGNPTEFVYIELYRTLFKVNMSSKIKQNLERVLLAQLDSRKQNMHLDIDEVEKIAFEKGGASFMFIASLIDENFNNYQNKLFWDFGAFLQFVDDIFDLEEDLYQRVPTPMTKQIGDLEKVELRFKEVLDNNIRELNTCNLETVNTSKIKHMYHLISAPTLSYLDFIKKASSNTDFLVADNFINKKYKWHRWKSRDYIFLLKHLLLAK